MEAGGQIHSQNAIPCLIGFRGKHFAGAAAGIIDEDVQAAIDGESLGDSRFHGRAVGDIAREKSDIPALGADRINGLGAARCVAPDGNWMALVRSLAPRLTEHRG